MVDSIVSVRMPSSLVQKLRELSEENHFLDVSEELRSVIRVKTGQYRTKIANALPAKKAGPAANAAIKDYKTENMVKEEIVKRLKEMIRGLEDESK